MELYDSNESTKAEKQKTNKSSQNQEKKGTHDEKHGFKFKFFFFFKCRGPAIPLLFSRFIGFPELMVDTVF